jgi:hypothetical protein
LLNCLSGKFFIALPLLFPLLIVERTTYLNTTHLFQISKFFSPDAIHLAISPYQPSSSESAEASSASSGNLQHSPSIDLSSIHQLSPLHRSDLAANFSIIQPSFSLVPIRVFGAMNDEYALATGRIFSLSTDGKPTETKALFGSPVDFMIC